VSPIFAHATKRENNTAAQARTRARFSLSLPHAAQSDRGKHTSHELSPHRTRCTAAALMGKRTNLLLPGDCFQDLRVPGVDTLRLPPLLPRPPPSRADLDARRLEYHRSSTPPQSASPRRDIRPRSCTHQRALHTPVAARPPGSRRGDVATWRRQRPEQPPPSAATVGRLLTCRTARTGRARRRRASRCSPPSSSSPQAACPRRSRRRT